MDLQTPAFNTANRVPDINPLDATLASDPQANALWTKVRGNVIALANAFAQLSAITDNLFRTVASIEGNTRLTARAQAQDLATARNQAGESIEALRRQCESARASILAATAPRLSAGLQFDPTRDMFGQVDVQRSLLTIELTRDAWTRAKMVLDAATGGPTQAQTRLFALAKQAAARNDKYTLAALRQNGPAYLDAQGLQMPDAAFMQTFSQATAADGAPEVRAAMQIEQTVETGWRNLQAAFLVASGYAKGSNVMRVSGLPGWPGFPEVSL